MFTIKIDEWIDSKGSVSRSASFEEHASREDAESFIAKTIADHIDGEGYSARKAGGIDIDGEHTDRCVITWYRDGDRNRPFSRNIYCVSETNPIGHLL